MNRAASKKQIPISYQFPPNTTDTVYVPTKDAAAIRESGKPASQAEGVKHLRQEGRAAVFQVGSGDYVFTTTF